MSKLTEAYFKFYHGDEAFEWAESAVDIMYNSGLDNAWKITLELINTAPTWNILSFISAGELEILCENHGPEIIARLKKEATTNIRVLHAMQCVVLSEENCISDEFYQFLEEQKHRDATKCINMPLRPGFYIDDP